MLNLSQLSELSTVEYIDLSNATSASLFRPHPQQEVKYNLCFRLKRVLLFLVARLRYEMHYYMLII